MGKSRIKPTLTKGVARVPVVMQLEALECGAALIVLSAWLAKRWAKRKQAAKTA